MPVKAVLFDLDGTLVDSNDLHVQAWEAVFRRRGVEASRAAIHDQIGKGADQLVPALVPGADEATIAAFGDDHAAIFKSAYLGQVKPFPGAHDLVASTHDAGLRAVLASSASRDDLEHYLDLLDIRDLVDAVTSADDVEASKPAPDIFRAALQRAEAPADGALAVGDSPYDAVAAGRCGVATLAVRSGGFPDRVLRDAGAVALYDDVAALLADFDRAILAR